jgi:hypothetical protein
MNAGTTLVQERIGVRVKEMTARIASKAVDLNQFSDKLNPIMENVPPNLNKVEAVPDPVYPEYFQSLRESLSTIENCLDSIRDKINRVEI